MNLTDILSMFGTETARQKFIELCSQYYGERVRQETTKTINERSWNSRRAEAHNQIMQIVQKLFLRSKSPMPSRKELGEMIMEYFRSTHSDEGG